MGQKFLSALERCPPWRGLNWKVPKFKVRLFYTRPTLTRTLPPPYLTMGMWNGDKKSNFFCNVSVYRTSVTISWVIKTCQFQIWKHSVQGGFYFEQLSLSLWHLKSWANRVKFLKSRRSWKPTLLWRKKRRRVFDYNQPDSTEAFHKFHHISLINKIQAFVLDCE